MSGCGAEVDGTAIAIIPEISADISMRRLLRGQVAPLRLDLIQLSHLRVTRTAEGDFQPFGLASGEPKTAPADPDPAASPAGAPPRRDVVKDLLAALDAWLDSDLSLIAPLRRLTVVDGSVEDDDRLLGQTWYAPKASADLRPDTHRRRRPGRADRHIRQRPRGCVRRDPLCQGKPERPGHHRLLHTRTPAALTRISPALTPLEGIESPLSGRLDVDFDSRFQPTTGRFSLTSENTRLLLPPLWTKPFTAARTSLSGSVDLPKRRLMLDDFTVDLGGPKISVSGEVDASQDTIEAAVVGSVTGLPVDLIDGLWPPGVPSGAHDWIAENLHDGVMDRAEFSLQARAPLANLDAATVVSLDGTIRARDLTVNYFKGLPPITGVNAAASFNRSTMRIATAGGHLQDVALKPADITITGLDLHDQAIEIIAPLEGPVKTVMSVLDAPRLGYAKRVGLVPDRTSGRVAATLHFAFPLLADLNFDQITTLGVDADLTDVGIVAVRPGYDVSGTNAKLTLDPDGMTLDGKAQVNSVPVAVTWHEAFDDLPVQTKVMAKTTLDPAARTALHLPDIDLRSAAPSAPMSISSSARAARRRSTPSSTSPTPGSCSPRSAGPRRREPRRMRR